MCVVSLHTSLKPVLKCKQVENDNLKNIFKNNNLKKIFLKDQNSQRKKPFFFYF